MPMTALTTASQQNPLVLITFPFSQAGTRQQTVSTRIAKRYEKKLRYAK